MRRRERLKKIFPRAGRDWPASRRVRSEGTVCKVTQRGQKDRHQAASRHRPRRKVDPRSLKCRGDDLPRPWVGKTRSECEGREDAPGPRCSR